MELEIILAATPRLKPYFLVHNSAELFSCMYRSALQNPLYCRYLLHAFRCHRMSSPFCCNIIPTYHQFLYFIGSASLNVFYGSASLDQ